MRYFQQEDPEATLIRQMLQADQKGEGRVEASLYGGKSQVYVLPTHGMLQVLKADGKEVDFAPKVMRPHILHVMHRSRSTCHPGETVMMADLQKYYYWPCMERDVEEFVAGCLACARAKAGRPMRAGRRIPVVPETPLSVVHHRR